MTSQPAHGLPRPDPQAEPALHLAKSASAIPRPRYHPAWRWWVVARYELKRKLRAKSFIVSLLVVPFLLAITIGLGFLIEKFNTPDAPLGYVDLSGFFLQAQPAPARGSSPSDPGRQEPKPILALTNEAAARQALEAGEIQAYYLIPADYPANKLVELYYFETPDPYATGFFWDFLQRNVLNDLPPQVALRAVAGPDLVIRWPASAPGGGKEFSADNFFSNFAPVFYLLAFFTLLFMNTSEMAGVVAEEKANRTIEIMTTSISTGQWMAGKVFAMIGIVIIQVVSWALIILVGLFIADLLGWFDLSTFYLDVFLLIKMTLVFIPVFILLIALMVALSASVNEPQEAQSVGWIIAYPIMIPLFFLPVIVESTSSTLVTVLSLIPFTAPATLSLRFAFHQIPWWDWVGSMFISCLFAAGAVWFAGRALRLGMLRYGQRLGMKELFSPVRRK